MVIFMKPFESQFQLAGSQTGGNLAKLFLSTIVAPAK
jgi:hypothetical protein